MAVLAPIPSVSARRATQVKPRFLASRRKPKRMLRARFIMRQLPDTPVDHTLERLDVWTGRVVTAPRCEKGARGESVRGRLAIFLESAGEGCGSGKQPRGEERPA